MIAVLSALRAERLIIMSFGLLIANVVSVVVLGFWVIPPVLAFIRRYEAKRREIQYRQFADSLSEHDRAILDEIRAELSAGQGSADNEAD